MRRTVKTVIGVLSGQHYDQRRSACMATWAKNLAGYGDLVDLVFLVGGSKHFIPQRVGNILYLPCPDDYASLPQKTRHFCLWALENYEFEYLLKCDDDTYVHLDRLLAYPSGYAYVGHNLNSFASGGAGYLLNRTATVQVVANMLESVGCEDVLVGQALSRARIPLLHDPNFHPWNSKAPAPNNTLITGHYCDTSSMLRINAQLEGRDAPKLPAADGAERLELRIPRIFHHIWIGDKPLPDKFQEYIDGWKRLHPDWEFKLWTNDNQPALINQAIYDKGGSWAQKADVLRYELLYNYGGVSLDTDFECLKNIEPLIGGIDGFAASEDGTLVSVGIIGSIPGHPLYKEIIDRVPERFAMTDNPVISTGPGMISSVVPNYPFFKVFGPELFYPIYYTGVRKYPLGSAYAVHHWAHSW